MEPQDLSQALRTAKDPIMSRRRGIVALPLAAAGSMGSIALYRSGPIRHLPEPPLPALGAGKVNVSSEAFGRLPADAAS